MMQEPYAARISRCAVMMKEAGLDVLLLVKPANMAYLTGDGHLCAYAMITRESKVALGVPSTDEEDVRQLARFDHLTGFADEARMISLILNERREGL
ncbi:MAG: peptidase M24 [uncultured bacterium]|nr:MAG: peptidase M24 [uncultured bacterium]